MHSNRHSFLIRIWFEIEPTLKGYAPALRGSIQHIQSGEVKYFLSLEFLAAFIEGILKNNPNSVHPIKE